jgi:hypothetical protein
MRIGLRLQGSEPDHWSRAQAEPAMTVHLRLEGGRGLSSPLPRRRDVVVPRAARPTLDPRGVSRPAVDVCVAVDDAGDALSLRD